ncbi:UNVERIFIED_CONTAM: hypothetical protein Sradi_2517000, partial [Sesamum radiatum]
MSEENPADMGTKFLSRAPEFMAVMTSFDPTLFGFGPKWRMLILPSPNPLWPSPNFSLGRLDPFGSLACLSPSESTHLPDPWFDP